MQPRTQSDLEMQFLTKSASVESGESNEREAFGLVRDWIMELEGTPLMLHPLVKTWFCYDKAHEEWVDLGIGPGEAILVALAGVVGAKRLPPDSSEAKSLEERVRDLPKWFMSLTNNRLVGPHHESRLKETLAGETLLWSPSLAGWTRADVVFQTEPSPKEDETTYCTRCGNRLGHTDRFCSRCGNKAR